MKQKVIRYVVMIFALGVFVYSAYQLTLIYIESKDSMENYDEIKNMFIVEDGTEEVQTDAQGMTIANALSTSTFVWDYEKMLEYNSDALGYIRQDDGTYIDNPILQYTDNDYYLTHLANHEENKVGSIFVDSAIDEGLNAKNPIVHGHNLSWRVNYIMFTTLNWYIYCKFDGEYYKNHPTFDIYIGHKHYKYYVFATYKTKIDNTHVYQYAFDSDEDFLAYVNKSKKLSVHDYPLAGEIKADDKIITFSTCCNDDSKRMIVQAVRREEIMDVPNAPVGEEEESSREVISIGGDAQETEKPSEPITEATTEKKTEKETEAETTTKAPKTEAETTTKPPETETTTKPPETTTEIETTTKPPETEAETTTKNEETTPKESVTSGLEENTTPLSEQPA